MRRICNEHRATRLTDVDEIKTTVREELSKHSYVALTTDGWCDDFHKISYVTVTVHYFNSEMGLQSRILHTGRVAGC